MTLFPIDWLGSMFLFCSHGVKPSFQAAYLVADDYSSSFRDAPSRQSSEGYFARKAQAMVRNCAPENPFLPATSVAPWILRCAI
jgi:hypothetical protein